MSNEELKDKTFTQEQVLKVVFRCERARKMTANISWSDSEIKGWVTDRKVLTEVYEKNKSKGFDYAAQKANKILLGYIMDTV